MINNLENANSQTQSEEQQSQPKEDLENKQPNLISNAASPVSNNDMAELYEIIDIGKIEIKP